MALFNPNPVVHEFHMGPWGPARLEIDDRQEEDAPPTPRAYPRLRRRPRRQRSSVDQLPADKQMVADVADDLQRMSRLGHCQGGVCRRDSAGRPLKIRTRPIG
jgi:hypothetical protein